MLLTTGLVSLNVHEALTFDGTEIVLHPDLFAPENHSTVSSIGGTAGRHSSSNIRPSPSTATNATNLSSTSAAVSGVVVPVDPTTNKEGPATSQPPTQPGQPANSLTPNPSIEGGSKLSWAGGGGGGASPLSRSRRLEVGDMIEIRVWDPIPAASRDRSHPSPGGVSAVFRKRSTLSVHSGQSSTGSVSTATDAQKSKRGSNTPTISSTPGTTASATPTTTTKTRGKNLDSVAANLSRKIMNVANPHQSSTTSVGSMQYSEFSTPQQELPPPTSSKSLTLSPSLEVDGGSSDGGGQSVDDTTSGKSKESESVAAIGTNTGASDSPLSSLALSPKPTNNSGKPPVGSTARGRANTTDAPRLPIPTSAVPKPPLQPRASTHGETFAAYEARKRFSKPTHSREISDMTADSMLMGGQGLLQNNSTNNRVTNQQNNNNNTQNQQQLQPSPPQSSSSLDLGGVQLGAIFSDQQGVGGTRDEDDDGMDNDDGDDDDDDTTTQDDALSIIGRTHVLRFSFAMLVTEKTLTSLKGSARTQVSILRQVADLYKLSSYDMVSINRIEKEDEAAVLEAVSADFVLVSIKDQFVSRGDMHLFQKNLLGSWIYEGQRLSETAKGIKAHAWLIRHGNQPAKSGIVTEDTMITFRSRSSRIFWLVQISAEMWDYASPYERERGEENESLCEIYFDKWISFVHRLFDKWKALEVTHSLTVVFFSRTFLSSRQAALTGSLDCKDVYGRPFEDHYKTVIENETNADWESLVVKFKGEFLKYPLEVGWNLSTGDLGRRPSNASQGNVLEAINITSNLLQFHYLDRDLHRTGNSLVVVSPGCGVFEVDKGLAGITYQRMMDNGIGSDMLSLGLPPLHIAPFFLYNNEYRTVESRGVDTSETYYEIPHWMHLAFISYDGEGDNTFQPQPQSEVQSPKNYQSTNTPLPVGANGFILPRKDPFDDSAVPARVKVDPNSPTSFSVNGIAASSPEKIKRVSQERALNEGRDFLDILEACRPRNSGTMPSALQAILKMYRRGEKIDRSLSDSFNEDTEEGDSDELKPLKEWTSMDLDLDEPHRAIRPRSGSFGFQDKSSERSDSSVLSSPSSSYASLVGVSFDKHLLGRSKGGAPLGGIFLQRSLSLQHMIQENNEDTDTVKSDGSWSTMGAEGGSDPATDEDVSSLKAAQKEKRRHADFLRKIIANHDSNYFSTQQVSAIPTDGGNGRPPPLAPLNEPAGKLSPVGSITHPPYRFSAPRTDSSQSGGIGAALSHYKVSHDVIASSVNESLPNRIRLLNPTDSIGATRTSVAFSASRGSQWNDLGVHAISPLLLPPPGMVPGSEPPELVRPEDRLLSSRLLPRDYKPGPSRESVSSRSLNAGYAGRTPTNYILSGELFIDPKIPRLDPTISVKSVGGGSPRAGDLYRAGQSHIRKPEKHGHGVPRRDSSSQRHASKKVFNPFRQEDEDKVLAKRSHNRRRWSHVFPQGEIEFKRHSGPIWKSLTSPAILPLSVDFFPSRQEIDQFFQFNIYNVTLSDFENTPYSTHADLLMEMVRQRLSQDYQLVPPSCVDQTIRRPKPVIDHAPYGSRGRPSSVIPDLPSERNQNVQTIKHFLTMGHQLQELTYDPSTDTIEVVRFNDRSAQNDEMNTYKYQYLLYSPLTQKYTKVVQTFRKYANQYNWNKVDRIICGDEDRTLREGMRFRRLMYALIPPKFSTPEEEQDYVAKFKRLTDYLTKVREGDSAQQDLKVTTSADPQPNLFETKTVTGGESMHRSVVQLRKGRQDPFEWIELATDFEFSTSKSFRIVYNWLAASSSKVDAQIQLLHRRCTQYGLNLIFVPQTSISRDLLLNPFKAPPTFCVRDEEKAKLLYSLLLNLDFVNDGVFYTQTNILECIQNGDEFDFGRRLSTAARQYVHRSGTLFVRLIRDRRGWVIVVVIPNGQYIKKDELKREALAKKVFKELAHLVGTLTEDES